MFKSSSLLFRNTFLFDIPSSFDEDEKNLPISTEAQRPNVKCNSEKKKREIQFPIWQFNILPITIVVRLLTGVVHSVEHFTMFPVINNWHHFGTLNICLLIQMLNIEKKENVFVIWCSRELTLNDVELWWKYVKWKIYISTLAALRNVREIIMCTCAYFEELKNERKITSQVTIRKISFVRSHSHMNITFLFFT